MTQKSSAPKEAQPKSQDPDRQSPAGLEGIGIPPPAYGIESLDSGAIFQRKAGSSAPNHSGLPDALKSGVEALSGLSLDDVRVHFNSPRPAKLQALAYTQGTEIYVGPGQERQLPHEAWHVVQQAQGRVKPMRQMKGGVPVNDDQGLEHEADVMGKKAVGSFSGQAAPSELPREISGSGQATVQRAIIAIDGATDKALAKNITLSALQNLKTTKNTRAGNLNVQIPQSFPKGDARGKVYGPALAKDSFTALADGVGRKEIGPNEALYILGHGSGTEVADLYPEVLANELAAAFRLFPLEKGPYKGSVKLIACYSASKMVDGKIVERGGKPVKKTYAEAMAAEIESKKSPSFQPSHIIGVTGIAWVDELTGRKTGFDVTEEQGMNPLEKVYEDPVLSPEWYQALQEKDPAKRHAAMDKILNEARLRWGNPGQQTRITGKKAIKKYPVNIH